MQQQHYAKTENGYVTLVTVILISIVAGTLLVALLLLGASAASTSNSVIDSAEARAIHDACANRALETLRNNPGATGTTNSNIGNGSCSYTISDITGEVGGDGGGNVISLDFEELPGSTVAEDDSGFNRDFTCAGAACPTFGVAGQCGLAASFDGANDVLEDSDGESYINGLTAFSLSMWIQSDLTNTDRGFIITFPPNGNDDVLGLRYDAAGLYGGGNQVIKSGVTVDNGSGIVVQQMESTSNVQTNTWQHIVLTWENGDDIQLYINGVIDSTPTYLDPAVPGFINGASTVLIGRGAKDIAGTEPWDGRIDNFDIWDRVLTQSEISYLYSACELNTQTNKQIEITSVVEGNTRKVRIKTQQINPEIIVKSWEEVDAF